MVEGDGVSEPVVRPPTMTSTAEDNVRKIEQSKGVFEPCYLLTR